MNAEKDMDLRVENESREFVGAIRHLIVKSNQQEMVEGDKSLHVKGNHLENIDSDMVCRVGVLKVGFVEVIRTGLINACLARKYGVEMIAPHRQGRQNDTQDGRPLRCYRKRWRVEQLFAWLHHFRRLVTRWEHHIENFFDMARLGCMKILLRYF